MNVDFYYDVVSPNAYLCHRVLPQIAAQTGARFRYIPCLLGGIFKATGNLPPFVTYAKVKGKMPYEDLEIKRFVARHGIDDFKWNPHFPINSLLPMRVAVAADRAGHGAAFVQACLPAMWEAGQNLSDAQVLQDTLIAAGLDGGALVAAAADGAVKQGLIDNTQAAVDRGVFGVPTFFVGDEMYFGKERLGQIEDDITRQMGVTGE